jgi:hypothetical protein
LFGLDSPLFFAPWPNSPQPSFYSFKDSKAQSPNQIIEKPLKAIKRAKIEVELAAFQLSYHFHVTTSRAIGGGAVETNAKKRFQELVFTLLAPGIGKWKKATSRQIRNTNAGALARRMMAEAGSQPEAKAIHGFRLCVARRPLALSAQPDSCEAAYGPRLADSLLGTPRNLRPFLQSLETARRC